MNCKIIQDLLPLYRDEVCSQESRSTAASAYSLAQNGGAGQSVGGAGFFIDLSGAHMI